MKNKRRPEPIPVKIVHDEPMSVPAELKKDSLHMSIRQIDNGFIVNRHGHRDGKFFDEELFTPTHPAVGFDGHREQGKVAKREGHTRKETPYAKGAKHSRFAAEVKAPALSLNVPSDAPLKTTTGRRGRDSRLMRVKL